MKSLEKLRTEQAAANGHADDPLPAARPTTDEAIAVLNQAITDRQADAIRRIEQVCRETGMKLIIHQEIRVVPQ